ncbi:efflux RND transporter periplasmic adaptor subunit [Opitutaceae bacterium EW11]|nr:efflux RND transporter periplasmic adaptor subunit [Opitutaceae bacterium EW11]
MKMIVAIVVLLSAAVAAIVVLLARGSASASDPGTAAAETVRVVRRTLGSTVKATGVIKPRVGAEVRVGSRLSGVVSRLYVMVGDRVEAGQPLAELDARDLIARREQAEAEMRRCLAEMRYAEVDLKRKRELAGAAIIPPSELDLAERAGAVAAQQLEVARANLGYAVIQLDYSRITAPISGVVASVATQEGETVAASFSAPTFVTLIDLARLEVWAYVDETDIGRIRIGQPARFTVDTYGEEEFEGKVTAIYPKPEIRDNVVNYITVVRFEPPPERILRPDMTTTVRIAIDVRENVLTLPTAAVRSDGAGTYVVSRRDGALERRPVATGARDQAFREITGGLREGDEVLLGQTTSKGESEP